MQNDLFLVRKSYSVWQYSFRVIKSMLNDYLVALLQITGNDTNDFYSLSANGYLADGETSSSCTFNVRNDNIPEVNETFTVQLIIRSSSAELESPSVANITILSSDDPQGKIGFSSVSIVFLPFVKILYVLFVC